MKRCSHCLERIGHWAPDVGALHSSPRPLKISRRVSQPIPRRPRNTWTRSDLIWQFQNLQAAVAIDPRNVETQANLGALLYFQGKATDAIPHLRAATTVQPDLAKIRGLLGLAEVHTSDIPAGRKDVRPVSLLTKQPLIGTVFSDRLGQRKCAPCGVVPFIDL